MGCICGEKIRNLVELYGILNAIASFPLNQENFFKNSLLLINHYSENIAYTISNTIWRKPEEHELDFDVV